jgi:hypothetical protein
MRLEHLEICQLFSRAKEYTKMRENRRKGNRKAWDK